MNKYIAYFFILFLFVTKTAYGQFEGVINIKMTTEDGEYTSAIYISNHNIRSEQSFKIAGIGERTAITLRNAKHPNTIFTLNPQAKTYSQIKMEDEDDDADAYVDEDEDDTKIEKLGQEKILGYTCEHIRVSSYDGVIEFWLTKDVLDLKTFFKLQGADAESNPEIEQQLAKLGFTGFPLKILDRESNTTSEVTAIEKKSLQASLFEVPSDYKKSASVNDDTTNEMLEDWEEDMPAPNDDEEREE